MNIFGLLNQERTRARMEAGSRKKVLECMSEAFSHSLPAHSKEQIFEHFVTRERLGSTGLGGGVALPHCRLTGVESPIGALVTIVKPIDYDAPDNQPVDVVFGLIVPDTDDDEHLKLLAQLAELFTADNMISEIRTATDAKELLNLIHHWQQHAAA